MAISLDRALQIIDDCLRWIKFDNDDVKSTFLDSLHLTKDELEALGYGYYAEDWFEEEESKYVPWQPYYLTEKEVAEVVDRALENIKGIGVTSGSGYYGLKGFELLDEKLTLYCEICKLQDDITGDLNYSVYYAVEFDEGDTLFSDWAGIDNLDTDALKKCVYKIASSDFSEDVTKHILGLNYVEQKDECSHLIEQSAVDALIQDAFSQTIKTQTNVIQEKKEKEPEI